MKMEKKKQAYQWLEEANAPVFLTGAGVSVPSGIPDYRSMDGVYAGYERPEYLLSHTCLQQEPDKFYEFVKQLYHPEAKPNVIHRALKKWSDEKETATIITQNIDQLHQKAGSQNVLNFHGNLYQVYCQKCRESVTAAAYLKSDCHEGCGGRLRPNVVLYEEGLHEPTIQQAFSAMIQTDLVMIIGTSFQVYPFRSLIDYVPAQTRIVVVNREPIQLAQEHLYIAGDASDFFKMTEL